MTSLAPSIRRVDGATYANERVDEISEHVAELDVEQIRGMLADAYDAGFQKGIAVRPTRKIPSRPFRRQSSWKALSGKRDPLRELWSLVIRTRDGFTCQLRVKCDGRSKADGFKVEAMHVLGAGAYPQIKFLSRNGLTGCVLCHKWLDEHKGGDGRAALRRVLGDTLDWLFLQAKITRKPDLKMAKIALRAELRELQGRAEGIR